DADVRRRLDVALPRHVRVDERAVAAPVLCGAVDGEDLRHAPAPVQPLEEPAALASDGILLPGVGEREEVADRVVRVERGLTEAAVDLAAPRARHVRNHRVEDGAAPLVLVEAEIEQMAEEPAALRHAEDVGMVELTRAGIL